MTKEDRQLGAHGSQRFGPKVGIVVFVALALGAAWAAGIVYFRYAVERQIEYTYRSNENLAAAFAAHTEQSLKEIEGMLRVQNKPAPIRMPMSSADIWAQGRKWSPICGCVLMWMKIISQNQTRELTWFPAIFYCLAAMD